MHSPSEQAGVSSGHGSLTHWLPSQRSLPACPQRASPALHRAPPVPPLPSPVPPLPSPVAPPEPSPVLVPPPLAPVLPPVVPPPAVPALPVKPPPLLPEVAAPPLPVLEPPLALLVPPLPPPELPALLPHSQAVQLPASQSRVPRQPSTPVHSAWSPAAQTTVVCSDVDEHALVSVSMKAAVASIFQADIVANLFGGRCRVNGLQREFHASRSSPLCSRAHSRFLAPARAAHFCTNPGLLQVRAGTGCCRVQRTAPPDQPPREVPQLRSPGGCSVPGRRPRSTRRRMLPRWPFDRRSCSRRCRAQHWSAAVGCRQDCPGRAQLPWTSAPTRRSSRPT